MSPIICKSTTKSGDPVTAEGRARSKSIVMHMKFRFIIFLFIYFILFIYLFIFFFLVFIFLSCAGTRWPIYCTNPRQGTGTLSTSTFASKSQWAIPQRNRTKWLNVCTAPHHTTPGKMQYRTDGNSRILLIYFVPDPSFKFIWYSVFEVGRVGRVDEMLAYMYVGSVG